MSKISSEPVFVEIQAEIEKQSLTATDIKAMSLSDFGKLSKAEKLPDTGLVNNIKMALTCLTEGKEVQAIIDAMSVKLNQPKYEYGSRTIGGKVMIEVW